MVTLDMNKFTGLQRQILELVHGPEPKTRKAGREREALLDQLRSARAVEIAASIPYPTCCAGAKTHAAVRLRARCVDYITGLETPAQWFVEVDVKRFFELGGNNIEQWHAGRPATLYCPYCGTRLPKMVRNEAMQTRPEMCEDYCGLCEERLDNCMCLPPEAAYKPEQG